MADAEGAPAVAEPGAAAHPSGDAQHPATGLNGAQGGEAGPSPDWRATLPAGLRAEKSLATFKDVGALAQAFVETKGSLGSMTRIPGADAKPEELAAFREKLGVPKDATGYKAPELEGLDPARWEHWAGAAHKLGLTPTQLEGLATLEAEERRGQSTAQRQAWAEGLAALKGEWGKGQFDRRTTYAARAVDRFATPELKTFLDESGLGDHPELVKAWAAVGELLAEDGYIEGRIEGIPGQDEARRQVAEIRAQGVKHPANNPEHPQFREARAVLDNLYQLGWPEPPTR